MTDPHEFRHITFAGEIPSATRDGRADKPSSPRSPSLAAARVTSSDDAEALFAWFCSQRGLDPRRYRSSIVRRRFNACLRAVRSGNVEQARSRAAADPDVVDRALAAVLVGVTAFFRDGAPFDALATELSRPGSPLRKRPLTVLSAACSDGQELYSAGIVLGEVGLLNAASLWGIDCRPGAIEIARRGEYPLDALDGLPPRRRLSWFELTAEGAVVRPSLRARTCWRLADAFDFAEPAEADIIMCRNLVIYLDPDAARDIWSSLAARLRPEGLLMVGKAERPPAGLGLVRVGACLYRKAEGVHR